MEDNEELIPINVWLAGRSYRLRIMPDEEEPVRKAVKQADAKITELRSNYAGKDDQDFVAMCLLSYAADGALSAFQHPLVKEGFDELSKKLDDALNED
ncbi:MAG: cell division protein ZapA [Chitinophagales bacterium]|nr:cell division protein ZapA [Chitinophagaceae bacterium]MCB9065794.1 cell division protein ZapA [Chitinophagales bacterium]